MPTDKKLHYELPPLDLPALYQTAEYNYEESISRAQERANRQRLTPKPPELDPFTGWRLDFDPDDPLQWAGLPPALPGADPARRLHPARGRKDGPLYVSPNILPSDPAWVKLAYLRYPMDRAALAALLGDMMPVSLFRAVRSATDEGAARQSYDQSIWFMEMAAWLRLTGDEGEALHDGEFTEGQLARHFSRPVSVLADGESLIDPWRGLQRLAVLVLWAWGARHNPLLSTEFCHGLADWVGKIWQKTHPRTAAITQVYSMGEPPPRAPRADIWEDREEFAERQRARVPLNTFWEHREEVVSVARLIDGLSAVIGSAGYYLEACPNCERLFFRPDDRKLFCSPYCRTAYNRKRPTGESTASALAAKRRKEASKRRDEAAVAFPAGLDLSDWR